jgi:protein-disulfide isomerase
MDKRFWGIIAVIGLVFVGIIWASNSGGDGNNASNNTNAQATSHIKGDGAKGVTLVEYGDFQCPVCALYEPTVQEVYEKHKADIKFQFRHFPLQQIHQNAFAGARAAEAASQQGKFWEMHDQLFQFQNEWSTSSNPLSLYEGYAKNLGLNVEQFKTDFASDKVNDTVNADLNEGNKLKVTGTPTFFLDGKQLELADLTDDSTNQPSADKLSKLIEEAIAAKQKQQ